MDKFKSADEALDFAIAGEEESYAYYLSLADRVDKPWMKDLFKSFAVEEQAHRAKLIAVKKGRVLLPSEGKVMDLKLAEYTEDVDDGASLDFQDALLLAMKKEKKAFRLYTDLAAASDTDELRQTFTALAQEEARHKLRIEVIYDDEVLTEN